MPLTSMPKNIKVKQTHRRTVPVIFILVFLVNSLCTLWLAHLLYLTTPSSTDADNRGKKNHALLYTLVHFHNALYDRKLNVFRV